MDFRMNRGLMNDIHNSPHVEHEVLTPAAHRFAGRVRATTAVDTGETAASTDVEGGHRSADGRSRAVRVTQRGASVQRQWGNSKTRADRHFDRARGGGA